MNEVIRYWYHSESDEVGMTTTEIMEPLVEITKEEFDAFHRICAIYAQVEQTAKQMLKLETLPYGLSEALMRAVKLTDNAGGVFRSRQAIAAIIVAIEMRLGYRY